ncbi:hypothetical protein LRB_1181 [Ligilactobacillus ruminis]|uniref:Uncharacterized protein n=1 Tax=Ligilactobacillus ruminis TaxID=1623 RepID=A0A837IR45_9LACO|nr:hypothetical protein LRB_1181 [Ligilactobacillus ruminis]
MQSFTWSDSSSDALFTRAPLVWRERAFFQGVEASAHDSTRKLGATEGELASSRESLLAIGGMRAGTRLGQGVEASGHYSVQLNID